MKHQNISNRGLISRKISSGSRRNPMQPGYWLLMGLVAIFTLVIFGMDPNPAEATRHLPLQLSQEDTANPPEVRTESAVSVPARISAPVTEASTTPAEKVTPTEAAAEPVAAATAPEPEYQERQQDPAGEWHEVKVKSGDSLALIFSRLDLSARQLHEILDLGGAAHNLTKIYPGQTLRFLTHPDTGLVKLEYQIDDLSAMEVRREADGFEIITAHRTPERRIVNTGGIINSSLFLTAQEAGLSDNMTMELANIFGWDIDFALDIRKGDQFSMIYEELYLDGEKIGNGNILAAAFVNRGNTYQAVRYTDQSGRTDFYSPDGKSMRKAFLRTPVEFSRISSRFSLGRKHPILNRIRAHRGVDYAAPRGTPIKATGDGKIVHRGKKGGYGNTIIVQHGSKYSTLYAHMSKYRGGLKQGSRVKQGQVIGYIGSTGLATGPHLHYELRVDGVHRDPLRVKLPGADPLNKKYIEDFQATANALLAQLDLVSNIQVASSD